MSNDNVDSNVVRPHFWMHEASGILRPVIEDYLNNRILTKDQYAVMRIYLRQWIAGPWQGEDIETLRTTVDKIETKADLEAWIAAAVRAGVDPL
jgi:hypothetical protein